MGWVTRIVCVVLALVASRGAVAQVKYPERIGQREFIADTADLITPADEQRIRAVCERLLDMGNIPFVVVTISSMKDYGAAGWNIERYAMNLFDEWGIGSGDRNFGVLLLVSRDDRKVRIEMGAGWSHDRDAAALEVIDTAIVPRFKAGRFSEGIAEGVTVFAARVDPSVPRTAAPARPAPSSAPASQAPARSQPPVTAPASRSMNLKGLGALACPAAAVVLAIVLAVMRRGGGYGGGGLGIGRSYGPYGMSNNSGLLTGLMLGGMLGRRSGGFGMGSGGGFGGLSSGGGFGSKGSFGGGFSGRGGATGSW